MPRFGHKKTRTTRAATVGTSSTIWGRLGALLADRGHLLRLGLFVGSLFLLLVAVEGWRVPFTYRLGDHPAHGILAKIDFNRVNEFETKRARSQGEAEVPSIFLHEPELLAKLPDDLRSDLKEVAAAESLDSLSSETQIAFGLVPPEGVTGTTETTPEELAESFWDLKAAVVRGTVDTADPGALRTNVPNPNASNPLDEILDEFTEFIKPLEEYGVVDPAELNRNRIRSDHRIAVVPRSVPDQKIVVTPSDVLLREVLKDPGRLGKSWAEYSLLFQIRPSIERWLISNVPSTLEFDTQATLRARRAARESVEPVTDTYHADDILVAPGQLINEDALAVLKAEYDQAERQVPLQQRVARTIAIFIMLVVLAVLNAYYLVRNEPKMVRSIKRLSLYMLAIVISVALGRLLSFDPWRAEVIPLIATAMVFAIAYNQVFATLTAFTLSLLLTLSTVMDIGQFVLLMSASTVAIIPLTHVPSRSKLIKVGFWTGVVYFVVSWGGGVMQSQSVSEVWSDSSLLFSSLRGAGWCLAAGYLVAGSLPFVESAFGVVTDISLLEMSDVSHPLLQALVRRAPGTYNHSISVATIAETAADSIGANGLLVRVGAYYHDIGKMVKPHYFIENMTVGGESRHDHLAPAMSTLIIIGHVKDGVDLARQHNLPQPIVDFIEQHHGTTLVQYFFNEASKQADLQPDHRSDVEESAFRYPGPKPQSREAGVMMLADAVESASRTLSDPTPKRIENLVHKIMLHRLLDGQFEESSLTLSEIRTIEESLTKSLIGVYHGRIKYPEQRSA